MPMLKQTPGLPEALKGEMTPKFLATRNAEGVPNVVPVISTLPQMISQTRSSSATFSHARASKT
jgi:hypothetical protein